MELGIAYANGKKCYGVKTDARSVEYGMDLNPMIAGCCEKLFKNIDGDELIEELGRYLSENELQITIRRIHGRHNCPRRLCRQ